MAVSQLLWGQVLLEGYRQLYQLVPTATLTQLDLVVMISCTSFNELNNDSTGTKLSVQIGRLSMVLVSGGYGITVLDSWTISKILQSPKCNSSHQKPLKPSNFTLALDSRSQCGSNIDVCTIGNYLVDT